MSNQYNIRILRYDPRCDKEARYEDYIIDHHDGMRIWEALEDINLKYGANIAWRTSCREFMCGLCTIMANGKPALACKVPIENGMVLEPLPYLPLIRDLVINRDTVDNRLQQLEPWPDYDGDISQLEMKASQAEVLPARAMSECITCLSCLAVCPAIRNAWETFIGPMYQVNLAKSAFNPLDSTTRIAEAAHYGLFNCTQCGACADVCPKGINIPEKAIHQLRALFLKKEDITPFIKQVLENIQQKYNPWGREQKQDWAKELNLPETGDTVLFAGCLSSFESGDTLRKTAALLNKLGIKVAYYAGNELCCGAPFLNMGDEEGFTANARELARTFQSREARTVITGCAECFKTLIKDYPKYLPDIEMPNIKHISQVIAESINQLGTIERKMPECRITYHDPCRLGRDCGIYDAPREIIRAIKDIEFHEMAQAGEQSFCCGAGGGVKLNNSKLSIDMGRERIRQARETGSSVVLSTCPWCEKNLKDSLEADDNITIMDVVDFAVDNL